MRRGVCGQKYLKMEKVNLISAEGQVKEIDLDHAQRIFDIKIPNCGWKLQDENYELIKGKITKKEL